MAIAFRSSGGTNSSIAVGTANLQSPATVVAGDVWICALGFRGGSGYTTTALGSGLTYIGRVDNGDTSILMFWYVATGSETASANFSTVTMNNIIIYASGTLAFSGAQTASPIVKPSMVTATGTSASASTGTIPGGAAIITAWCWGASSTASSANTMGYTMNGGLGGSGYTFGLSYTVNANSTQSYTASSGTSAAWGSISTALQPTQVAGFHTFMA